MPFYELAGFDEWCRIQGGLSNAQIAKSISKPGMTVDEDTVRAWRQGVAVPDPETTLFPLQAALNGPWHPATAEKAWQALRKLVADAIARGAVTEPERVAPAPAAPEKARRAESAKKIVKTDPVVDANKRALTEGVEQLRVATQAADPISVSLLTRTTDKFKKYATGRDEKHRKAYLAFAVGRAQGWLEKTRARRADLAAALSALEAAITEWTEREQATAANLGTVNENAPLWKEIKAGGALAAEARQVFNKAASGRLAAIDDMIARGETVLADWTAKHDAIVGEAGVSLSWVKTTTALVERLRNVTGEGDPFEGLWVCKDKLADGQRALTNPPREKPVEVDLAREIDLTIASLELKQKVAREATV